MITIVDKPLFPHGNVIVIEEVPDQDVPILLIKIFLILGETANIGCVSVFRRCGEEAGV